MLVILEIPWLNRHETIHRSILPELQLECSCMVLQGYRKNDIEE